MPRSILYTKLVYSIRMREEISGWHKQSLLMNLLIVMTKILRIWSMIQEQRKRDTTSLMTKFLNQTIKRITKVPLMMASNDALFDPASSSSPPGNELLRIT